VRVNLYPFDKYTSNRIENFTPEAKRERGLQCLSRSSPNSLVRLLLIDGYPLRMAAARDLHCKAWQEILHWLAGFFLVT